MKHISIKLAATGLLGIVLLASQAHADDFQGVIEANGAPIEKIEKETKRTDVWVYQNNNVVFHNGKIATEVQDAKPEVAKQIETKDRSESPPANVHEQSSRQKKISNELLDDILRSIPSDESADKPGLGQPGARMPQPN